jgi:hypothetical protein
VGKSDKPPVAVYKDGAAWHWVCRVPSCVRSEWRVRHDQALSDAQRHLDEHKSFGFKR